MSRHYDIVVTGAGMVGSCAALMLARSGFKVALIEPNSIEREPLKQDDDYDLRVSAISPTSEDILTRLGIWQQLDANRICHYEKMTIWHQNGDARIHFDSVDLARQNLGVIVENRQVLEALRNACSRENNIDWYAPDSIVEIEENTASALSLQTKFARMTADLLVVAEGRGSATRDMAGFEIISGDYHQQAIIANIDTELVHEFTAWQRFLSTGPLALLPLANGQSSIVWSADNAYSDELMNLHDGEFRKLLTQAFEERLGQVVKVSQRQRFPLSWLSCDSWLIHRVLLIGDAAHGVHPLAGQGVNLGFSDVDLLNQKLMGADNAWHKKSLRRFERQRKSETAVAMYSFSGLKQVYGNDHKWLCYLRDIGMKMIDNNDIAKRMLIQQALNNMA